MQSSAGLSIEMRGVRLRAEAGVFGELPDLALARGSLLLIDDDGGTQVSRLLQLLAGRLHPAQGSIHIEGQDLLTQRQAVMRNIGLAIDCPAQFGDLQVAEYLRLACTLLRCPLSEVDTALSRSGLTSWGGHLIRALNAGQRYRLAVAHALLGQPWLLLVREPQASMDRESRSSSRQRLLKARDEGCCVVLAARQAAELQSHATHQAHIAHGKITVHAITKVGPHTMAGSLFLNVGDAVRARAALLRHAYQVELVSRQQLRVHGISMAEAPRLHARLAAERVELFQSIYERPDAPSGRALN